MISAQPTLLIVTGLLREAQIADGQGVVTLCSGGSPALLQERLSALVPATLHGGGSPVICGVLSFGLAGGLAPHLRSGDLVISSSVQSAADHHPAHQGWLSSVTSALGRALPVHTGKTAGHDLVVAKSSEKTIMYRQTGALAVDMESHIAADYARRHNLPFMAIRAVSDPATRNLPPIAAEALLPDGKVALRRVIMGILRETNQLPALIAAGMDSERAFASLRRCRRLLGPLFGLGRAHL